MWKFYSIRNSLFAIVFMFSAIQSEAQVVINKIYNGSYGASDDVIELLVTTDNADLRNLIIKDFSSSSGADGGRYFQFTSINFWKKVKAGTLIILHNYADLNTKEEIPECDNFVIDLGLRNTTFFTSPNNNQLIDIEGSETIMIKSGAPTGNSNNIHSFKVGANGSMWAGINSGSVIGTASTLGNNFFAYITNATLSFNDFSSGYNTNSNGIAFANTGFTWGQGNNVNNTNFINFLRGPVSLPATAITANSFTANWSPLTNAQSYVLDVSRYPDFSSFLTGYNGLNVGSVTSLSITADLAEPCYYRVRAVNPNIISTGSGNSCPRAAAQINTLSINGSQFCSNGSVSVPFNTIGGIADNNVYTAQLSDSVGSFSSPVDIGTLISGLQSGTINATIPANTSSIILPVNGAPHTGGYKIRVISSNPEVIGSDNGSKLIINPTNFIWKPSTTQEITFGNAISFMQVTETVTPIKREWAYGTSAGGPYTTFPNSGDITFTPTFSSEGTYYVVCISQFSCRTYTSNAVKFIVASISTGVITPTLCPGSAVAVPFTSKGDFTGNTYTAQLSSNNFASAVNIGTLVSNANTGTISATIPANTPSGQTYRIRVKSNNPDVYGTNNGSNLTVTSQTTWIGQTNNWNTPSNWSCGAVPNGVDVTIPVTTNNPVLNSDITVKNIELKSGASLALNGNTFAIAGALTGTGTITGSLASNLSITGTGTFGFTPGSDLLNNLTINTSGTVSLGSNLNIAGVLTPVAGTFNLNGKVVTLKSGTEDQARYPNTATYPKTGTVGKVSGVIAYGTGGAFVVERYIPARRKFRFISPSVNATSTIKQNWMEGQNNPSTSYAAYQNALPGYGTQITGKGGAGNGFDETRTNNASLFIFKNNDQQWGEVQRPDTTGLSAGSAWRLFVRGSRSTDLNDNFATPSPTILRTTGTLTTGPVTFNKIGSGVASANNIPVLNGAHNGLSLIGNPYASPIDWNDILKLNSQTGQITGTAQDISTSYITLDPTLSDGPNGVYVDYNAANPVPSPISDIDNNIQPGQAFFIRTFSPNNPSPNPFLTISEANKTSQFTTVFRGQILNATRISLQLLSDTVSNSHNIADGFVAVFDDRFSLSIGKEDSYKITNTNENIAITRNGIALSIEGRPAIVKNDTLPLKIWRYRKNKYYLKISGKNFDPSVTAFVKDAFLKQEIALDLASTTLLQFAVTNDPASSAADRFVIVFKRAAALPVTITDVKAYRKEEGIQLDWNANSETNVERYEVEKSLNGRQWENAGIVVARGPQATIENYVWYDGNVTSGQNFYRIKVLEKSGINTYSNVAMVNITTGKNAFSVYPNPVKGGIIKLQLDRMEKGQYMATLYNNLGQKLYSGAINHSGNISSYRIITGKVISKGTYRLQLTNGKVILNETIIFE